MTGQAGDLETFRKDAAIDKEELGQLRTRMDSMPGRFSTPAIYSTVQAAALAVHEIEERVAQLRSKYLAALAEDDVQRQRRYEEMIARVNRGTRNSAR